MSESATIATCDSLIENLTEQEVRAFVGESGWFGPEGDYYLKKWQAGTAGIPFLRVLTGFNWAAFFVAGLWLPYRKMYRITAIFYGIIVFESILEEVGFVGILRWGPEPAAAPSMAVALVAGTVCGYFGNWWYLSHTRKVITEVRSQRLPEPIHLQTLAKRGGVSIAALLVWVVAMFLILFPLRLLFAGMSSPVHTTSTTSRAVGLPSDVQHPRSGQRQGESGFLKVPERWLWDGVTVV